MESCPIVLRRIYVGEYLKDVAIGRKRVHISGQIVAMVPDFQDRLDGTIESCPSAPAILILLGIGNQLCEVVSKPFGKCAAPLFQLKLCDQVFAKFQYVRCRFRCFRLAGG